MSARKEPESKVANIVPFGLRMPPDVRKLLQGYAEKNQRSLNAEIVARLLESLEPWKPGEELTWYDSTNVEFPSESLSDIDELLGRLDRISQNFASRKLTK